MTKAVKPEDVLSDSQSYTVVDGIRLRKGTIAAAVANARVLASESATDQDKKEARQMIEELAEGLVLIGLYEQMTWKNEEIQKIMEKAAKKLGRSE